MKTRTRTVAGFLALVAVGDVVGGQEIRVSNWTVPPYRATGSSGGVGTMADATPGVAFVGFEPCRIVDTRGGGVFSGAYGSPALAAGVPRTFDLNSAPHCPGIAPLAEAYSLNVTVVNTAGPGHLVIYPTGGSLPNVSSINYLAGETIANAVIVPADNNGSVTVVAGVSGTHLLIDINGYFTEEFNPGVSFEAASTTAAPAILANNSSNAGAATAIHGIIKSTTPGAFSAGVLGQNNGTAAQGIGVWGVHFGSGWGVHGSAVNGRGVFGRTSAATGRHFGVVGQTSSTDLGASGVLGFEGGGRTDEQADPVTVPLPRRAGVRGESRSSAGVLGVTHGGVGVEGVLTSITTGETVGVHGRLADFASGSIYAIHSLGDTHVAGDLSVTGTKAFVQPHPTDPSKEIRFLALEGPRSEVYFRGSAQISRGVTRIEVPEYFRLVAAPESYSALVTPVGAMATVAVLAKSEDGIVVQASRDVRVDYVVYAERAAARQASPIVENRSFRSRPDMSFLHQLPDSYRRLMIQNGTLNADGTVNLETARRLGWDREWEKVARPEREPIAD